VIRGCYIGSVVVILQLDNLVMSRAYLCGVETEERRSYNSWRVAEDKGKKP